MDINQILLDYKKYNNLKDNEEISIRLDVEVVYNKESPYAQYVYISHDGSSGAQYKVSTTEDVGEAIQRYLEEQV